MINNEYTIINYPEDGKNMGRYLAKNPISAAKKAFGRLSKEMNLKNSNNKNLLVFSLLNKNTGEMYKYIGTRIELVKPIIVKINGKNIKYKYKNIVTPYGKFIGKKHL